MKEKEYDILKKLFKEKMFNIIFMWITSLKVLSGKLNGLPYEDNSLTRKEKKSIEDVYFSSWRQLYLRRQRAIFYINFAKKKKKKLQSYFEWGVQDFRTK